MGNVLIVDDESTGKIILKQLISNLRNDINVITLSSGTEGLKWLSENKVDLIITDYSMPEMNGVEFIQKIRSLVDCEFVPIIMITVVSDLTVSHQALKSGATAFLKRPIDEIECETTCNNLLKLQEQNQVINDKADWLARSINIATQQIEFREKSTLQHIGYISSYRIQGEPSNFTRLSKLVYLIASGMGLTERECRDLEYSSPLHDAGMINLPDNIIHNNAELNDAELQEIKTHTIVGNTLLSENNSRYFRVGAEIALYHHEKFDGTGYPFGLKGINISLNARIISICSVFEALMSYRSYREAWSFKDAISYIRDESGKSFDPGCVDIFLERFDGVRRLYSDI